MRAKLSMLVCVALICIGCTNKNVQLNRALDLREKVLSSNGCTFRGRIVADYVDRIYNFSLDCQFDSSGNMTFTVQEPNTIFGITGVVTETAGSLTFDDKAVAFPMIADGQITPVTSPWVLIKSLRSGYLIGCSQTEGGYRISIDDSYDESALHLEISVDSNNIPVAAEIYWEGYRVITIAVEEFVYL